MESPREWNEAGNSLQMLVMEILPRLGLYLPVLRPEVGKGLESLTRFLFAEERRLRAGLAVQATRAAGGTLRSSALSPAEAYFLFLRCRQSGCDFAGQVFPPSSADDPFGALPEGWDVERLKRWLLVDLWNRRSDSWLKLVALEWVGPFPFYGLEPAPEFG